MCSATTCGYGGLPELYDVASHSGYKDARKPKQIKVGGDMDFGIPCRDCGLPKKLHKPYDVDSGLDHKYKPNLRVVRQNIRYLAANWRPGDEAELRYYQNLDSSSVNRLLKHYGLDSWTVVNNHG